MNAPTIFSRILLVLSAIAVMGLSYWFIATSLAPVEVPQAPPARGAVHFDPTSDITKKPKFGELKRLGPEVVLPTLGRQNPFAPIPSAVAATTTTLE